MDDQELQDAASAFAAFTATMRQAERMISLGNCGHEFESLLQAAKQQLSLLEGLAACLDAPYPQRTVKKISPILRARLTAVRERGIVERSKSVSLADQAVANRNASPSAADQSSDAGSVNDSHNAPVTNGQAVNATSELDVTSEQAAGDQAPPPSQP